MELSRKNLRGGKMTPLCPLRDIESHDMPLDVGQSSESPPGIPELRENEDSLWKELPYKEVHPHLLHYQQHQ